MKVFAYKGKIVLSELGMQSIVAMFKIQIDATLVLSGEGLPTINLNLQERFIDGSTQKIKVNNQVTTYESLLKGVSSKMNSGYDKVMFTISTNDYRLQEPLVNLAAKLNLTLISECVYIKYDRGVFHVVNKSFPNGDSNRLLYYENNNTLLVFGKDGPALITDNPRINNVTDVLCDIKL